MSSLLRLPRFERVRSVKDFKALFKAKRVNVTGIRLYFLKNDLPYNRIALTLPRGYGNAIQRNRSKRVTRSAYRLLKQTLKTGYDLLVVVYKNDTDNCKTRLTQLSSLFERAGLKKSFA